MKTLTPDEQHDEVTNATIRILRANCATDRCEEVSDSFDNESSNVFVDRLLDEGWQVYGRKKILLCPRCAEKKGLAPIAK